MYWVELQTCGHVFNIFQSGSIFGKQFLHDDDLNTFIRWFEERINATMSDTPAQRVWNMLFVMSIWNNTRMAAVQMSFEFEDPAKRSGPDPNDWDPSRYIPRVRIHSWKKMLLAPIKRSLIQCSRSFYP